MPDKYDFPYRYANESDEDRIKRHSSFLESSSDFLSPSVLGNLGVTEPVAERAMYKARKYYEEDLSKDKEKDKNTHYSFQAWLEGMASAMSKVDPKDPAYKDINPVGTAELYREISRLQSRTQSSAARQEIKDIAGRQGAGVNAALSLFGAAKGFADTASGGTVDTAIEAGTRLFAGKEAQDRYVRGREFLRQLQEAGPASVRFGRGFGETLGVVEPAAGISKAATIGRAALTGGGKALKEGSWRLGMNKALATALGAAGEEAGLASRSIGSAGNFLATEAGLKVLQEVNTIAQGKLEGDDWRQRLADLHGSPEMDLLQSTIAGATMPFMQKVGDRIARTFMGRPGSARRMAILGKSLSEMEDWSLRTQAIVARGLGGSAEFSGLSFLPNLHDPNQPFGVVKDFAALFGEDSDERTRAIENLLFHAANGFLIKNLHGTPNIEHTPRDRAAALAPGVDMLGVAETLSAAKNANTEDPKALFPHPEDIEELRRNQEGEAYQKIGEHVSRQYGVAQFGPEAETMPIEQLIERFTPEQRKYVEGAINSAVRLVASTGKGYRLQLDPNAPPKVVSYSKEASQRYGITPDERKALRIAIREIIDKTSPEEKDQLAANLISEQALAEAASGMGGGEGEPGAVDKVLEGMAQSATGAIDAKESAGAAKPDEQILARQMKLDTLYTALQKAQVAGDLQTARTLAEQASVLETELESLSQANAPGGDKGLGTGERPLTPGVKPKALDTDNLGDAVWPQGFGETARGQPVRVLIGQTSDKKGIFRDGLILHVDDEGLAIVETHDGKIYGVIPADVATGKVRGDVFTGLEMPVEPDGQRTVKPAAQNAQEMEHKQIKERGDHVEPIAGKPGKMPPVQGPEPLSGLLPAGEIAVKPPPEEGSGGVSTKPPPKPGPTGPEAGKPKPNAVTPESTNGKARFGKSGRRAVGTGTGSGEANKPAHISTSEVGQKPGPPGKSAEPAKEAPASKPEADLSVPTPEWLNSATKEQLASKLSALQRFTGALRRDGKADTDAYKGALKSLSAVAKTLYRKNNPQPAKPKVDTSEAERAFAEHAKAAGQPPAGTGPVAGAVESPAAKPPAKPPARLGSARRKRLATPAEKSLLEALVYQGQERRKAEANANTDARTGLGSQRAFDAARARVESDPNTHVILSDLKGFKAVNDDPKIGEEGGNEALAAAATEYKRLANKNNLTIRRLFRAGGDEFAAFGTKEQLDAFQRDLSEAKFDFRGHEIRFRASVGKTFGEAGKGVASLKQQEKSGGGGAAAVGSLSPTKAAVPTTTVRTVAGKPTQVVLHDLPDGYTIDGAVRSGNSAQIILKDKDGNLKVVTTGKQGIRTPGGDWKRPATTNNVAVFDSKGNVLFRGPLVVRETARPETEAESDTGRITSREQAMARLGTFRRKGVEKGAVESEITDPVKRAYALSGALAADPKKSADSVKVIVDDLYKRLIEDSKTKPENDPGLQKVKAAYDAARRVYEAKKYVEDLDERIKKEEEMVARSAQKVNPARLLSTSDDALSTSQRSVRDLASAFKVNVDESAERIRAGRQVKDLPVEARRKYDELSRLRKLADSLIESAPFSTSHPRVDVSTQVLPRMSMGDKVEIVTGGKEGSKVYSGIVVGSGEPSAASLKRGVGSMGQRVRDLIQRQRSGENLTQAQKGQVESTTLFPGKWVTIWTESGDTVRVRVSDIADIGPSDISKADFSYDPEKGKRGVEVTEQRFLSWFAPPESARSRALPGSGNEDQSVERTTLLLDNEPDGYYVNNEKEARVLSGAEAAELEAKVTASNIRNRTARPDQYRYQAMAILAPPEKRKKVVSTLTAHGEAPAGRGEVLSTLPAEERQRILSTPGEHAPADTYNIVTHWFEPGTKLRTREKLTDAERDEYDRWNLLAEQSEAERIQRDQSQNTYEENRKALVPISTDEQHGEWLLQHRTRSEDGVLRSGQTLLAERTPEGTIFVRRISPVEAKKWMERKGKGEDWERFRADSSRDFKRLTAKNNLAIAQAKMETQLRDYLMLLRKQLDEIVSGRDKPFAHEGDLHKMMREWVRENPPPPTDSPEYNDWKHDAEVFMFSPPHTERNLNVEAKEGGKFEATVEPDFMGKPRNIGGPMFQAAERVRMWREPNSGAQIRVDDDGRVHYLNEQDAKSDFYVAAHRDSPGLRLGVGLGAVPGGIPEAISRLIDAGKLGLHGASEVLRGFHAVTRAPASFFSNVMDGVTQFNRVATDAMMFRHIHDLLHHPDYGSSVLGETGKAAARKIGVLFGDSPVAPQMRVYFNDMHGAIYEDAIRAREAIKAFRELPPDEQEKMMHAFEEGRLSEPMRHYRDFMDEIGDSLIDLGLFTRDTVQRFRGKYIHHGRWVWKAGDIEQKIEETKAAIERSKADPEADKKELGRLRYHLSMLKNALSKTNRSSTRVFIGDHPLDTVHRAAIYDMYKRGFARERQHATMREAQKHGLDLSVPWLLLYDGMMAESKARRQGEMLTKVLNDPTIVQDADLAPHDWIKIEGTRYASDPILGRVVGKAIEPQALSLIEAANPDWSAVRQVWDMVSALAKSGLTSGNPTNWHTQVLGNLYTLATKIPFFQIPSRMAQAALTLSGIGKNADERLAKYRKWNWTHHTTDATREISELLDKDAIIELRNAAGNENPYMGMGFFETLGEAAKRISHGHVKQGLKGVAQAGVNVFTSLDAMARVAMHEHLTETMHMPELEARKIVDNYFDIRHLPKGWQFSRRFFDQFGSIKATMGRNLGELVPNSPVAITNLGLLSFFWNAAVGALTGTPEDERKRILEDSIPANNAFTHWLGTKTGLLMPDGKGSLRAIDMNKFSPTDTGIRSIPGLRPATSGVENMIFDGEWAPSMEGKGVASNIADFASSNLLYGPSLDYVFDRDRFNEGRGVRDQMQEPGVFGTTGYLRYMIERGNLPGMLTGFLPPGAREFGAGVVPTAIRNLKRAGEASDSGFLGTKPRYITGTHNGKPVARKYDSIDAMMEALGFQFSREDEYARVREILEQRANVHENDSGGLDKDRGVKKGTPESMEAKQTISDSEALGAMQKSLRLLAEIRHYKSLKDDAAKKVVSAQIKQTVSSVQSLKDMLRSLSLMEEYDLLREIGAFFEQDQGMEVIPIPENRSERLTKGRFGSLKNK